VFILDYRVDHLEDFPFEFIIVDEGQVAKNIRPRARRPKKLLDLFSIYKAAVRHVDS
jgi:hypothetical protein